MVPQQSREEFKAMLSRSCAKRRASSDKENLKPLFMEEGWLNVRRDGLEVKGVSCVTDVLSGISSFRTDSCNFLKTQSAFFDSHGGGEGGRVSIFLRKMFCLKKQR